LVDAFENGEDVYRIMASRIYHRPIDKITTAERFVGKTTILGAGYGMGWKKFQAQLKTFGVEMTDPLCKHIVDTYRGVYPRIPNLWAQAEKCLDALASEDLKTCDFGTQPQAVSLLPGVGFDLPSGLPLKYMNLRAIEEQNPKSGVWERHYIYNTRKGTTKIYGGKVVENICQAVARCVIGEQMLRISKKYRVVLTVHDAIACVVKKEEVDEATKYITECMKWRPKWAETLPLSQGATMKIDTALNYTAHELKVKELLKEIHVHLLENDHVAAASTIEQAIVELRLMRAAVKSHIKE